MRTATSSRRCSRATGTTTQKCPTPSDTSGVLCIRVCGYCVTDSRWCFLRGDSVDASVDPANWAIRDLTFETLVVIVCKGLARLETADEGTDFGLPESFAPPRGVAARHRLGSKLAGLFKVQSMVWCFPCRSGAQRNCLSDRSLGMQVTVGITIFCIRARRRRGVCWRGWSANCLELEVETMCRLMVKGAQWPRRTKAES